MRRHRVRTPTVLQMEATECGAASLGIVLGYYHRFVPLAELRVVCGVSRDGINAANVVKAARHYGLDAKGYRLEVDTALAGPFPAIVFWNFNHFLVVEGASNNRVYLNDPALGPRTISRQEFADSFTGILLRMTPNPGFKPGGEPPRIIPRLVARLAGTSRSLGLLVVLSALLVVPGLLIPGLTMVFVDQVLIEHAPGWLAPLLLGLCATMLLQGALAWLQKVLLLRLELWLALSQSASFLWRVLRLPIEFFTQRYNGDLVSRIESNDRVAKLLAADMGGAVLDLLTAVFMLIVMFLYDGVLASLAMVLSGLNVVVLRLAQRRRADMAIRLQSDQAKLFATSVIGLQTIETLKASGTEPDFFAKWAGYHARTLNSEQRLAIVTQLTSLAPALTAGLLMTAILGFGAIRVMHGDLTLGALIAFQMLVGNFTVPVQRMVEVAGTGQQAMADLARLDDVSHHALDWRHARETVATEDRPVRGEIALKNVTFGYSPLDPPLIEDFSLDVAPGAWVALVGTSGSGKSTIVRLVAGLHRPWSGSVELDGRPLETWDGAALADALATVDQDIQIFSGTMRENITLWDDTIPDVQMRTATADAALLDVVERLPGNFGGRIDEDGRNLSGGQRQRVEIARALARNPAVLILDEATAALDPVTEKMVAKAVRRRGCTCIIAAHRLSTIRDCDEIIVLDHGKVVERGRHAELMAMKGAYAQLVEDES